MKGFEMTDGTDNAFAVQRGKQDPGSDGLTKREYFAAMALQGILANEIAWKGLTVQKEVGLEKLAVSFADALIAALNKESK